MRTWILPPAVLLAALLSLGGCAHAKPKQKGSPATPPGAFQLMHKKGPIPTEALRKGERRTDLEIHPTEHDRIPSVVEKDTSPVLVLGPGEQAVLAGDAKGTEGWSIDNVLLFEVADPKGHITDRFIVGFSASPVYRGDQMIDSVGPWAPHFAANTPDLTSRLPHGKPFELFVTALDNGITGSVSDVYLRLVRTKPTHNDLHDEPFF